MKAGSANNDVSLPVFRIFSISIFNNIGLSSILHILAFNLKNDKISFLEVFSENNYTLPGYSKFRLGINPLFIIDFSYFSLVVI